MTTKDKSTNIVTVTWLDTIDLRKVLEALPSEHEPSRMYLSDLMLRTGLSCATVEAALQHLGDLGLIAVDKARADIFHPPEARRFHAGRVFVRR